MADYIIQPGDTLSSIAKKLGTTVDALQKANNIKNVNLIFAGSKLSYNAPKEITDKDMQIKGLSIERNPNDGGGVMKPVYAYEPPKGKDGNGIVFKPVYAYEPPKDGKDGIEPVYAYKPPRGKDGDGIVFKPVYAYEPPKDGKDGIEPVYAYKPPKDEGIVYKPVYAYIPPEDKDTPPFVIPKIPGLEPKPESGISASATDTELLKKRGASPNTNNPNAGAQFVVGSLDEVKITGKHERPDTIEIKDNTNGQYNNYKYRRITPDEIASGKTKDGQPLTKEQFKEGENYYILESATNSDGTSIKQDHVEVYRLELNEGFNVVEGKDYSAYNLIQDAGMDGSNKSSIDYSKRKQ